MCIAIHIDVHIKITNLFKNNKLKILETFMSNINLLKELDILGVKNYGTSEQPLFKAKDIGDLIGCTFLRFKETDDIFDCINAIHEKIVLHINLC